MAQSYRPAVVSNGDVSPERVHSLIGTGRLSEQEIHTVVNCLKNGEPFAFQNRLSVSDEFLHHAVAWSAHIEEIVSRESKMLHPSKEVILRSFLEGRAAFYISENEQGELAAVGYCRLIPLMTEDQRTALGLPKDFPQLYELGTVIVDQQKREHGMGTKVVGAVHQMNLAGIDSQRVLVLGTTTTYRMMRVLKNMMQTEANPNGIGLGIPFYRVSPTTVGLEYIGATTCVCNPHDVAGADESQRSYGMYYGQHACTVRSADATEYRLIDTADGQSFPFAEGGCMMFVSDIELAHRVNELLRHYTHMSVEEFARYLQN